MDTIYFSAEHTDFRGEVERFLQREVVPFAHEWEEQRRVPRSAWKSLAGQGLLGLFHSPEVGGGGRDLFTTVVFLEELGRTGYGGVRAAVSVHAYMATYYLARAGSAFLRETYLAPAVAGDSIAALAITEPSAGADMAGIATTAHREGDHFVLNGRKSMVSNGSSADFHVVVARTSLDSLGAAGLSLFVVDAATPGITVSRQETLGWRSADPTMVDFEAVRVPERQLLGRPGSGFYHLMRGLQMERIVAAVLALGGMDACMHDLREHLRRREAFGAKLGSFQAIRHRVADLATELTAARQLVYHAAWRYQNDEMAAVDVCSMAKLQATELAVRVADTSVQLHGSHGYLDDTAVSRAYRDARAATVAAGPSEVMRDIIARMAIDEAASRGH
ncbi:acyl-CoA dehydrogenase family protein [Salinactinospora qingdaonensis]|uniref:Acyl-CoA dehydrogenase family protein n=1 Tax=Salinactinospora qingdaonensis TaxID=702744 RepID=A0ABP7GA55_9ACTN